MDGAIAILRKRGFEVTEPAVAVRPAPVRAARAPRAARTPVVRATARPRGPAGDLPDVLHDAPGDGHLRRVRLTLSARSQASAPRAATTPVLNDACSR